jgi:hypothetical protein
MTCVRTFRTWALCPVPFALLSAPAVIGRSPAALALAVYSRKGPRASRDTKHILTLLPSWIFVSFVFQDELGTTTPNSVACFSRPSQTTIAASRNTIVAEAAMVLA